jgi:signal transduction histidine kinase
MRLAKFIMTNLEAIVTEWESFASTMLPEKQFDRATLRDDAAQILSTIAQDMETPQTASQQTEKSQGLGPKTQQDTSAETHSLVRLRQGFNQVQVISEFRALRATVIRLWLNSSPEIDEVAMLQLIRFNEGIDQVLAKSAARFMEKIEESTNFAVAVLAHDLRNPLHAILSAAQLLQIIDPIDIAALGKIATNMINSGTQMSRLIDNLLDFTRTRLGQALPVNRLEIDVAPICQRVVAELATAYPNRAIELSCSECLRGSFDGTRIGEMLSNLIANAIQHGDPTTPITVTVSLEADHMVFRLHNEGPPIPGPALQTILDLIPLRRKEDKKPQSEFSHLGIGLFIVKKIVEAHSGMISVSSTATAGTTFVVSLPCYESKLG